MESENSGIKYSSHMEEILLQACLGDVSYRLVWSVYKQPWFDLFLLYDMLQYTGQEKMR